MQLRYIIPAILLLLAPICRATDTMTGIFDPAFASLQVRVNHSDMATPVLRMGSDDMLEVHFDELADDRRYMRWRLVHCDRAWQPSDIVESEYLSGFNEATIDDYQFSRATTVPYIHYTIPLAPGSEMMPEISGNYLMQIYDEEEPETVLLQQRFMLVEPLTSLKADVTSHTDIDYNDAHQQLALDINLEGAKVSDPFREVAVTVTQNNRPDLLRMLPAPARIWGSRIIFEHQPELIFDAGNEYRRMETVSTRFTPMGVEAMEYHGPYYHAILAVDEPRNEKSYIFDKTQHGRFRIREYNATNPDREADYIVTHFALEMPRLEDANVFLDGDFTCRRFDENSCMEYDEETGTYRKSLLLKQGAYNYQYLAVPYPFTRGVTATVEGDRYQTINEYTVCIYLRRPGERYDRLVGVFTMTSC